jgi:hypothetical protein
MHVHGPHPERKEEDHLGSWRTRFYFEPAKGLCSGTHFSNQPGRSGAALEDQERTLARSAKPRPREKGDDYACEGLIRFEGKMQVHSLVVPDTGSAPAPVPNL